MIFKKKGRRSLSRVQHNIFISDSIGLFIVSKFTTCGKFRYQIDIISKTYPYLKSAITLWVKCAHLAALQLSNTGLLLEFIASNKLISPYNFSVFIVHFRFREAELGCWTLYWEGTLIVYVGKIRTLRHFSCCCYWLVSCLFPPPMPSGNLSLVGLDMTSQPEYVRNKGYYIRS